MLNAMKTLAIAATVLSINATAQGALDKLYSIDWTSDVLYRLDVNTGAATPVGPLNYDVFGGGDMTFYNGSLYHITPDSDNAADSTHTLLQINPGTGAVISSQQLTTGGMPKVGVAEGLTVKDGRLYVAYNGAGLAARSNMIGELSLSGAITNPIDFATAYDADIDGLATDANGQLFSSDSITQDDTVRIYEIDLAPQDYRLIGGFVGPTGSALRANDIAFLGNRFFGVDHDNDVLRELNPTNGQIIAEFSLPDETRFTGLATPEPGTLSLMIVAAGLVLRRRAH